MNSEQKSKLVAGVITVLLIAALIGLSYTIRIGNNTKQSLKSEQLRSESLLSEKLSLEKQINNFKNDIIGLQGKNEKLDTYLADLQVQLSEKQKAIRKLSDSNASLQTVKKENNDLKTMKDELLAQIGALNKSHESLSNELAEFKKKYEDQKSENLAMQAKLNERNINKLIDPIAGNFRIEPVKKNQEKLTVKARKANSIIVSFDVPKGNSQNFNYTMYRLVLQRPEGGDVNGQQKTTRIAGDPNITASITNGKMALNNDRVNISFIPNEKLSEGIYSIIVYEGNDRLGSAQVRLIK